MCDPQAKKIDYQVQSQLLLDASQPHPQPRPQGQPEGKEGAQDGAKKRKKRKKRKKFESVVSVFGGGSRLVSTVVTTVTMEPTYIGL